MAWVYILTNRKFGTLYIGATTDLIQRVWQHKGEFIPAFTRRYHVNRLVYFEEHQTIYNAMQRERTMKHWKAAWKVALIEKDNPEWDDLYWGSLPIERKRPVTRGSSPREATVARMDRRHAVATRPQ